jgi:hypothetical protein
MGLLTGKIAAETARMREALNTTLTQTGDVRRLSRSSDGLGGFTASETTVITASPLAIERLRDGDERVLGEAITGKEPFIVHFEAGTDVRLDDRIYIDDVRYDVIAVPAPVTEEAMRPVIAVKYT